MRNEVKVGVFIFLGLLSLIFLTLQVNSLQDFNKKGYTIYALIGDASGLAKKAKVKMRGVEIGSVEDLELENSHVKLKLLIKKGVKIPKNSVVTLAQDNFLGGKYVKIIPSQSYVFYKAGDVITRYVNTTSMDDVMANINTAVDDIKVLIKKLNRTLDEKTIANIKETIANIKDSSITLKSVLKTADNKLPVLLDNANDLVLEYKKAGVTLNNRLPSILDKTDSLLTKFNKTGDTINAKLDKLMDEYIKLGENANNILNDNKQGIKEAVASAKDFFVSGGESFKKIDNYLSSLSKSQILVDIQSNFMARDDYFKTSAYIAYLPVPTKYYILGVTSAKDFSDLSKINLDHQEDKVYISAEYGKRFDDLLLRGGIIENTGGIGFDYFLNHDKVKLSGEVYDFNAVNDVRGDKPHLTFKGTYLYLKHIQFMGGVDNILNTDARTFFLGIGVKFKDNDLKTILGGGATSFLK
ncbi:mce related protein [Nautilia profundicola AmH]|uniref:Mce related protein n=1 Tax=Nautilia profundicola (strain ATCC BAA-1463 / DSM 18972 / AmH) TaxID=598659 RepID=B9L9F0_NAUPA|nr:MlaD family protein [Nautilia profundicola]ACM92905.1 mce related protein [Nautilia profundicola AmH]